VAAGRCYTKTESDMREGEHNLQVGCVRWFRLQYPKLAPLLFAIPNGGWRNPTVAAKLKAEGVMPGVPDLFLAYPHGQFHGLWIEMKNGKAGRVSDNQAEMHELLRDQFYRVEVVRTAEQFVQVVQDYLRAF